MYTDSMDSGFTDVFAYTVVITIIICLMFYTARVCLRSRFSGLGNNILYVLALLTSVAAEGMYNFYIGQDILYFTTLMKVFILAIVMIGSLSFLYKDKFSKIMAISIICLSENLIGSCIAYYLGVIVMGEEFQTYLINTPTISGFIFAYEGLVILIMSVSAYFAIKFIKKIPNEVPARYWSVLAIIEALLLLSGCVLSDIEVLFTGEKIQFNSDYIYTGIIMLFLLVVAILAIYFFGELTRYFEKEKQYLLLKSQNAALLQQSQAENSMNENLRKFKHEINSLLTAIYMLVENKEYEEAKRILSEKTLLLTSNAYTVYTENNMVDALLNMKIAEINSLNIPLEVELAHLHMDLPFDASDMYSILLNLIENAIEANMKIQKKEERFIFIKICTYKNYFSIIIKNQYHGTLAFKDEVPVTNKPDSDLHGHGLKNVEFCVNQYSGIFQYTYSEDEFTVKVMLPLSYEKFVE